MVTEQKLRQMQELLGKYNDAQYFSSKYTKMLLNSGTDLVKKRRIYSKRNSGQDSLLSHDRMKSNQYIALGGFASANSNPINKIQSLIKMEKPVIEKYPRSYAVQQSRIDPRHARL
jgi:hypothetical protein